MSPEPIWIIKNGPKATDLPNVAELWCSEENESGSGGYYEVIYSVGGMKMRPEAQNGARPPFGHGQHGCVGGRPTHPSPLQGLGFFGA